LFLVHWAVKTSAITLSKQPKRRLQVCVREHLNFAAF